jgi:hypothetical protein
MITKLTCLTFLAIAACCACLAQEGPAVPDSAADPHLRLVSDPSFIHFTAVIQPSNKVWLQWDVDSGTDGNYFVIERSQDGTNFETIGALLSTGGKGHYESKDQAPPNGADFYRIKYTIQRPWNLASPARSISNSIPIPLTSFLSFGPSI